LPSIATVVIVLIGFVAGCSYILHLLAGDRVAEYSRVLHAVDKFADFQLDREEGMVKYELSIGRGQGVLIDPMQQFAIMLVHLFYPLLTALTMLKFIFAILFGLFWKERDRRVARERLEKRRRTSDQSLARNLMRNHGHLDQARDLLSALLYNLGWRNASAFVFTGNVKWLDVRRALPGFTSAKNASGRGLLMDDAGTTTPTPISPLSPLSSPAMFGATAAIRERASGGARAILDMHESRSTPIKLGADGMVSPISPSAGRWRRAQKLIRLTERSIHVLEDLLQRRKDYGGLKSHAISTTVDSIDLRRISNRLVTGEMRGKGLLTDSSRYLRMNQVNRQELTVPLLGMLGPTALGEVLHALHLVASENAKVQSRNLSRMQIDRTARKDGTILPRESSRDTSFALSEAKVEKSDAIFDLKSLQHRTAMDDLLYRFATTNEQYRLHSTTKHLQDAKHRQIVHDACFRVAHRIIHDIGWRSGSEFDHYYGNALAEAVLRRARDTARGMSAILADMMVLSSALPPAARSIMRKQANEAKRRSRWRATLIPVKLGNYKRKKIMRAEKLVRDAVRFGRRGVNAISKGSWYALRAMLTALCVEDKRGRLLGGILDEEREEDAFRWDDVEDDYMSSPRKPGRPKKRKLRKQLIKDVLRGGD